MAAQIPGYKFIQGKTLPKGYDLIGGDATMSNSELAESCNKDRSCLGFTTSTGELHSSGMFTKSCEEEEVIGCHIAHPQELANQGFYEKSKSNKIYIWEENKITILAAIVAAIIIIACIIIVYKLGARSGRSAPGSMGGQYY